MNIICDPNMPLTGYIVVLAKQLGATFLVVGPIVVVAMTWGWWVTREKKGRG